MKTVIQFPVPSTWLDVEFLTRLRAYYLAESTDPKNSPEDRKKFIILADQLSWLPKEKTKTS